MNVGRIVYPPVTFAATPSGWEGRAFPTARGGVTKIVLDCRHRVMVGSRRRLLIYRDGRYAPIRCAICHEDRDVVLVVWKADR